MRRARHPLTRRHARAGVAALEFALLAPMLTALTLSLYDVTAAVGARWDLSRAAQATALIATHMAEQPNGGNSLTEAQAITAGGAIFPLLPALVSAPTSRYAVVLTSVAFTASPAGCASACSYTPHVAWSRTVQGTAPPRPCGTLLPVADANPPAPGTIAADALGAQPLLLVDASYTYVPLLTSLFGAGLTMREVSYLALRTGGAGDWMRYSGPDAQGVHCTGYTS